METELTNFKLDSCLTTAAGRRVPLQEWLQTYARTTAKKLYIGTDSRQTNGKTKLTTVIASYLPGRGGTYGSFSYETRRIESLQERLQLEAWKSIELALLVSAELPENSMTIHLDVNSNVHFRSGVYAPALMGMVKAQGFGVEIKPLAFTATSLADALVRTF